MTTTQDTITGDPTISSITRIACCHAVRELRSMVANPVPVIALTQTKSESMYLMGNSPLDAQKMTDQKRGSRRLQGAVRGGLILEWMFTRSQEKHMRPEKIQMVFEPRESHGCSRSMVNSRW